MDHTAKLWDLSTQSKCLDMALEGEEDAIANVSFNFDGSLMAVATKTQAIHVADPRAGRSVLQGPTDFNSRAQRVVWCTDYGSSEVLLSQSTDAASLVSRQTAVILPLPPLTLIRRSPLPTTPAPPQC